MPVSRCCRTRGQSQRGSFRAASAFADTAEVVLRGSDPGGAWCSCGDGALGSEAEPGGGSRAKEGASARFNLVVASGGVVTAWGVLDGTGCLGSDFVVFSSLLLKTWHRFLLMCCSRVCPLTKPVPTVATGR